MKTIEEMLRNLSRPEVLEFGLVSNRLPSVNIGGKFEPVDDKAPTTDAVLEMLVAMGGSRYVESLSAKPTQWTSRMDGVGVIAIAAIMRENVVQARFTVARREPGVGTRQSAPQIPAVEARPPAQLPAVEARAKLPAVEGRSSGGLPAASATAAAPAPAVMPAPAVERKPEAKKQTFSRTAPEPRGPSGERKHDSDTNVMAQRPVAQAAPAAPAVATSPRASQAMPSVTARASGAMPAAAPAAPAPPPPPPASSPEPLAFGDDDDNEPTVQTFAPSASSLRTSPEALQAAKAALAAGSAPPAPLAPSSPPATAPTAPAASPAPPPVAAAAIQPIQLPPVVARAPDPSRGAPAPPPPAPADSEDIPRPKPARTREAAAQNQPQSPATKPAAVAPVPLPVPPPSPGSAPQVSAAAPPPPREPRLPTGTSPSLQGHRAGAPPAPPPPPAIGPKRIDTPTGFVLVENPPPARRPSLPPEPPPAVAAPPQAPPPPAPIAPPPAVAPPVVEPAAAAPPTWEAWDAPTETGEIGDAHTLVAPPLSEQERGGVSSRPASIPASVSPSMSAQAVPLGVEPVSSVGAPVVSSGAAVPSMRDSAVESARDVAPMTPTHVGPTVGIAPSGHIPSTELAQNFGTLDPIGDDPSVERAVIFSLPKQGNVDVDALLAKAKAERATDLHLVGGRAPMARIGGELRPLSEVVPLELVAGVADSLLPTSAASQFRREGAAMFVVEHPAAGRLRVHLARARGATHVSIRFIPSNTALGALELPERAISLSRAAHGLVLVTSPKGHGATTTAAAIVDAINESSARRVVVIDAPVEFLHPRKRSLITHVDVGVHARSYGSAVASAVKADADVICIGNVEDTGTMRLALAAAEEGRLVIATMRAKSTSSALERLVESFPVQEQMLTRATLASTLRLALGQRLVPSADRTKLFAAHEVLPESIALYTIIRDAKWSLLPTLLSKGKPLGVVRLEEALADLVHEGEVPVDLARPLALSPADFDSLVSAARAGKKG